MKWAQEQTMFYGKKICHWKPLTIRIRNCIWTILLKQKLDFVKKHTIITLVSDKQWCWFISRALLNILIQERYPYDGSRGLQLDRGLQSQNLFRLFFFCLNHPHFSISATDTMSTTETTNVTSEAEGKMRLFLLTPFAMTCYIAVFIFHVGDTLNHYTSYGSFRPRIISPPPKIKTIH